MDKYTIIKDCCSVLLGVTPTKFDCGILCGKKCCSGDENTGMLVFPGEADILKANTNMKIVSGKNRTETALCSGECNRLYRPLSCRIFPLFPLLTESDGEYHIKVVFDPRANCPLTAGTVTPEFVRKVKRVGKLLMLNAETFEFLSELSEELADYIALKEKLKK